MPSCTRCGKWFDDVGTASLAVCQTCLASYAHPPSSTVLPIAEARTPHTHPSAVATLVANEPSADFDPYYTWLGIPPARQPPNHYQLLGITDFEQNPDVISYAADRQMTHLRSFATGPRSKFSQRLLNEVAAARVCLRDPATKAAYDQTLRVAGTAIQESYAPLPDPVAPHASPVASEHPVPSAPPVAQGSLQTMPPVEADLSQPEPTTSPSTPYVLKRRQSRGRAPVQHKAVRQAISIVFGGLMGCAIGWFIVFVYLPKIQERKVQVQRSGSSRNSTPAPPTPRTRPPQQSSQPSVSPPTPRTPRQSSPVPEGAPEANPSRPPLDPEPSPPSPNPPAESPIPDTVPDLRPTLSSLPAEVTLPPISSRESALLMAMAIPEDLELELTSDLIALDSAYAFVAKRASPAEPAQWQIYLRKVLDVGIQEAVVAHLTVVNSRLAFRWTDHTDKLTGGQLRNCLMQLKSGGESHQIALRSLLRPGATGLPSEKDKFKATFDLEDLPRVDTLRLDVELSYAASKVTPQGGSETTTQGKRLDFKINALQNVEIQVALLSQQDSFLTLQALPRHQLSLSRQLTLSTEEVDELEQRLRQSIVKAQRSLAKAQSELQAARDELSRRPSPLRRPVLNGIVNTQTKAILANQKGISDTSQLLSSVGNLRTLVSEVHSKTRIRYRIYAEANESRLLLVDGEYDADEAGRTLGVGSRAL